MFKFVNSDEIGTTAKRQQSQKACENCRKRKKRCIHSAKHHQRSPALSQPGQEIANSNQPLENISSVTTPQNELENIEEQEPRLLESVSPPRFIQAAPPHRSKEHESQTGGHDSTLSGETQRQENPSQSLRPPETLGSRFIGDLSPESIFLAATHPDTVQSGVSMNDSVGVWLNPTQRSGDTEIRSTSATSQPPSSLFYGASELVQRVFVPMLEQGCLIALPSSIQFNALSKLYFERMHPIFPIIDRNLYFSLPATDPGQILLKQSICLAASKQFAAEPYLMLGESETLLSPQAFGDKLSGAMRLSIELGLVTNKIILIQAFALMSQFIDSVDQGDSASQLCARAVHHIQSTGLHVKTQRDQDRDKYGSTLVCCIWVIDRMNAAFNGRPVIMHERDLRTDLQQCFDQQEPSSRLFIEVVVLLDKVIGLYRPASTNLPYDDTYPYYDDLVVKCGGFQISAVSVATIETLYHAVTILSCRSRSWAEPQRSSMPYLRQILSASALSANIGRELEDQIVLFPFVPYAVSLSLSISYREMRHGKITLHRARARSQFQSLCETLFQLKDLYRTAGTTAEMGSKLLKEMDRVVSSVAFSGSKTPVSSANQNLSSVKDTLTYAAQNPAPGILSSAADDVQPPDQPLQDFDPSVFDSIADVDLFGMFDPAFDLNGFDACLEKFSNSAYSTALLASLKGSLILLDTTSHPLTALLEKDREMPAALQLLSAQRLACEDQLSRKTSQ